MIEIRKNRRLFPIFLPARAQRLYVDIGVWIRDPLFLFPDGVSLIVLRRAVWSLQ